MMYGVTSQGTMALLFAVFLVACTGDVASDDNSTTDSYDDGGRPPDGLGDPCQVDDDCPAPMICLLRSLFGEEAPFECVLPCDEDFLCEETYGPCFGCDRGDYPPHCKDGTCCD
jgi:hypothetical protein